MFDASGHPIHFTCATTTEATAEPLSLDEVKLALRVYADDEDATLVSYIGAARRMVERDTRRAILSQTRTMTLDAAPSGRAPILLPVAPVTSVTSITAYSTADAGSTVSASVYRLDTSSLPPRIVLRDGQDWPTGLRPQNALSIVLVCGYGATADAVTDAELVQAMQLVIGHWHANRSAVNVGNIVNEMPLAFEALTRPLAVPWM